MENQAKRDTLFRIDQQIEHLKGVIKSIDTMNESEVKKLLLKSWGITNKLEQINKKKINLQNGLPTED